MRNIFNKFIILYSQREHAPFENTAVPDTDLRTLPLFGPDSMSGYSKIHFF